jgi:hypothetical protein
MGLRLGSPFDKLRVPSEAEAEPRPPKKSLRAAIPSNLLRICCLEEGENYLPNAQNGMCWARMLVVVPNEGMIAV